MSELTAENWSPNIQSFLNSLITSGKPQKVVFDFDNTMVRHDFGEAVMNELLLRGVPWIEDLSLFFSNSQVVEKLESLRNTNKLEFKNLVWAEYDLLQKEKGLEAAYRWSSWIFSGRSDSELRKTASELWKKNLSSSDQESIKPYLPIKELISSLQKIGSEIWIVTASPEGIIQEVSEYWGISESRVFGMNLSKVGGRLTHEIQEPFTYGMGKVRRLKNSGVLSWDLAFGDTENDFPLLEHANNKGIFLDRGKGKVPPQSSLIQPIQKWQTI
ncbi:haloacid dehalogenase [Leptospira perolatii]|uniref:Haloacid dehalogenase n=1 Tax=Leptospira perolatii TaxID=2023191 RepID=A0A2M9ZQ90_9LEPT|nr:HAD-IB family phosphatase [Leptospira perolatii]PJZ69038.1 haloacid dehalogenase [Leptospira perolatii]PJZ74093.1 haloacid dehalogenase [Leptospira perolatii]